MAEPNQPATAAILLIGNELLTGKIRDENGWFLAQTMRRRGIRLVELTIVGDELASIGEALHRLGARAQLLFTAGGVGPTHDDVTLEAIARATGRPLRRNAAMERQLREHYGPSITADALRMADLPEGTELRADEGWPVLRLDLEHPRVRVYILPGVPGLLRSKVEQLETIPGELPSGEGWHLEAVYSVLDESRLASHLDAVVAAFPDVDIGSYPRWQRGRDGVVEYHVRVTLEAPSGQAQRARAARAALIASLPADTVVYREEPRGSSPAPATSTRRGPG